MSMTITTASGTISTLSPRVIRPFMDFQRPLDWRHVNYLVANWRWSQAQVLTVHLYDPHIIKYMEKRAIRKLDFDPKTTYHVSNGDHRLEACKILFGTDFRYTDDHANRGLMPKNAEVGAPVLLTCQISEEDPVDTFLGQNAGRKVSAAHKFLVRMNRKDEPETTLYKLVTAGYGIRWDFNSGPVGSAKNTTAAGHTLLPSWKQNRDRVIATLDIITTTYTDSNVIDPTALSEGFMNGLYQTLTTCKSMGYDTATVHKSLTSMKKKGWPAYVITRFCQATGGRAIASKTKSLMLHLVKKTIDTGKVPDPNSIDIVNLK